MTRLPLELALLSAALAATAMTAFVAWPLPELLLDRRPIPAIRFSDRTGLLLREVRSRADGRSVPLPPNEPVPPLVRAAFLAAEDRRFDRHPGVDVLAAARAAGQAIARRRIVSGASTIPMQLARQLVPELAPHRRTLAAKLREALWALRISAHLPREEMLRAYLDRVSLGNGTCGVEAAALTYFARPARTLSLGQAALLAAVVQSPERHEPWRHEPAARARMTRVLGRMRRARARLGRGRLARARRAARPRRASAHLRRAAPRRRARPRPPGARARRGSGGRDDDRPRAAARRRGDRSDGARLRRRASRTARSSSSTTRPARCSPTSGRPTSSTCRARGRTTASARSASPAPR